LIKNGHVVDPLNNIDEVTDVLVDGTTIQKVGKDLPEVVYNTIDATGCYVTPGIVDHHSHIWPLANIGLPADSACFGAGVTTVVDAGSSGPATYHMYRSAMQLEKIDIKAYLNVCSTGLASLPTPEDIAPEHINEDAIKACYEKYRDELLGLKIRTSKFIVKEMGYKPVQKAIEVAEKLGVNIMVHCTDPAGELSELLDMLRPGDVITHMYMNKGSCLVQDGKVLDAAYKARERGVLFEAADAREHFGLPVAEVAIKEGFLPDIIASDLTKYSMHLRPTAFNMAMQLSKYTALGIKFQDAIRFATVNPAKSMNMLDSIGSLTEGHAADIAIFRPVEKENEFGDRPYGNPDIKTFTANTVYQCVLTVKNGEMVHRDITF
ncbi:MAG: amidohydrolase family protein, partial [Lachnospiraceae bacterium]|nr:amidohydrolase family protein [Lachnospiraceae bacterium]